MGGLWCGRALHPQRACDLRRSAPAEDTPYSEHRLWRHVAEDELWILYLRGRWWITETALKDAGAAFGFVRSAPTSLDLLSTSEWEVCSDAQEWCACNSIVVHVL